MAGWVRGISPLPSKYPGDRVKHIPCQLCEEDSATLVGFAGGRLCGVIFG